MRRGFFGLLVLLAVPTLAAAAVTVKIVSPGWRDIVSGPTTVDVEVRGDGAAALREVKLYVDGVAVATLTGPPFTTVYDFGQDLEARELRAVATLPDGREVSGRVKTRRFLADQVMEVSLVNLYATVRDRGKKIVDGLGRRDFAIFEDGARQTISRFTDERRPLAVGLVLDTSLTMRGDKLQTAVIAATKFIEALQAGDRVLVVGFSDKPRVLHPLDDDLAAAAASMKGVKAQGGTALYDAIYTAAEALAAVPTQERRVLVVLSDGRDEAASGLEPGSFYTFDEAREQVLKREVIVFTVGLGKGLDEQFDFYGRRTLAAILEGLADNTGGQSYFVRRAGQLDNAYGLIGETLRHQYSLAYSSTNDRRDGGWRQIEVMVRDPALAVSTRKGYYAD